MGVGSAIATSVAKGVVSSAISSAAQHYSTDRNADIQTAKLDQEYKIKQAELDNSRRERIMHAVGNIHGPLSLVTTGIGLLKTKGGGLPNLPVGNENKNDKKDSTNEDYKAEKLKEEMKKLNPNPNIVNKLQPATKDKFKKGGSKWKTKK